MPSESPPDTRSKWDSGLPLFAWTEILKCKQECHFLQQKTYNIVTLTIIIYISTLETISKIVISVELCNNKTSLSYYTNWRIAQFSCLILKLFEIGISPRHWFPTFCTILCSMIFHTIVLLVQTIIQQKPITHHYTPLFHFKWNGRKRTLNHLS